MTQKARTFAFASAAIVIGTAAALLAAEIGLRLVRFEFALHPTSVQFGWPDPVTLERRYRLDADLLWVPRDYESTLSAWSGRSPTVVHMGDSCTEFGRYDDALAELVARDLSGVSYSFVNLGVGGWSSYQGLAQMKRDVPRIRPAIVTIYYGWNDHWRSYGVEDRDIGEFIRQRPAWVRAMGGARVVQLANKAMFALHEARARPASAATPERVSLADFEANLARMVRLARDEGIVPVLLTAPTSHQRGSEPEYLLGRWIDDFERLVPLHIEYVEAVRRVSHEHDVPLVDLFAAFDSLPAVEREAHFNTDGIHLNDAGNARIASILFDHFVRWNLLAPAPSD